MIYRFFLFLVLGLNMNAFSQAKLDSNFHLYILMGQSNMAGRGPITDEFKADGHPNLWMLTADAKWVLAQHPIHFDKPKVAAIGPGMAFGMDMAKSNPKVKIGLIPCAVGGTSIEKWRPGAYDSTTLTHPYDDAMTRIRTGMMTGVIKGVIWHQGEANSNEKKARIYLLQLDTLVKHVRNEVGQQQLPWVVGELGRFKANYNFINAQLAKLSTVIPFTALATSEDLNDKGDLTHFDGASANELGHRLAKKMIELQRDISSKKIRRQKRK